MPPRPPNIPPAPRSGASAGLPDDLDDPDDGAADGRSTSGGTVPTARGGAPSQETAAGPITPPARNTRPRGVSTIQDPDGPSGAGMPLLCGVGVPPGPSPGAGAGPGPPDRVDADPGDTPSGDD